MRFRSVSAAQLLYALLFVTVAVSAQAEWKIVSTESEPGRSGIEHRHVVIEDAGAAERVTVDLAVFPGTSTALRVKDNPEGQTLAAVMKQEGWACGVNGGYFDTDFKPIGLRVTDRKTSSPLRRARLITGILLQSDHGIDVVRAAEFAHIKRIAAAVQSGPFLVEANKRIRGLNDSQSARRTFAGVATNDRAFVGLCSNVSLGHLADILATAPLIEDLKVRRAINLDGGSSSTFWFAREDGSAFSIPGRKPVRDFVGVVPK